MPLNSISHFRGGITVVIILFLKSVISELCDCNLNNSNMARVHHINCVEILAPTGDRAIGHCTVIELGDSIILLDTGVGLQDCNLKQSRLAPALVDAVGFKLDANITAVHQLRQLQLDPLKVTDIVLTHLDCDHIGGVIDFPNAKVHLAQEEYENYLSDNPRYVRTILTHNPHIIQYGIADYHQYGLEMRKVDIEGLEVYLTPLFGHTLGHCGVVYCVDNSWSLYIGDAYYLRDELTNPNHPIHALTTTRADDNILRLASLETIKRCMREYPEVNVYGYHDKQEFIL